MTALDVTALNEQARALHDVIYERARQEGFDSGTDRAGRTAAENMLTLARQLLRHATTQDEEQRRTYLALARSALGKVPLFAHTETYRAIHAIDTRHPRAAIPTASITEAIQAVDAALTTIKDGR